MAFERTGKVGSGSTRSRIKISAAYQKQYRDGQISEVKIPLYLTTVKEHFLNSKNPLDDGAREYLESQHCKLQEKGSNYICNQYLTVHQRLDQMLNASKTNELPILEELGLDDYCQKPGAGILPIGRESEEYILSKEDFEDDFEGSLAWIKQHVESKPQNMAEYRTAAKKMGETIIDLTGKDKKEFMKTYCCWRDARLNELMPTESSILKQPTKILPLDFFGDSGITYLRFDGYEKGWKTQGFLYVLGNTLYYADPFSSNGSTIMTNAMNKNQMMELLRKQIELDANEKSLKRVQGTGRLEKFILEEPKKTIISMRREFDDDGNFLQNRSSPVTHIPLLDLSSTDKTFSMVSVGTPNPITKRQSCSLIISKVELTK